MRAAYKFLAYAIDALILLQAAMIAWAIFGESKYIDDGHTVSKALQESDTLPFPEVVGFIVHGINGELLIPLVGLILLIVSFFAKVTDGTKYAAMLFGGIVIQVLLGLFAHGLPLLGMIHGLWALLLFALAFRAAKLVDADHAAVAAPEDAVAR
jgi:hypothetical protein